jgi:hypothetical protein
MTVHARKRCSPWISAFVASMLAGCLVLLRSTVCSASDSSSQLVSASMYGGYGPTGDNTNEGIARYDVGFTGAGVFGRMHPWARPEGATEEGLGGFFQLGVVGEWHTARLISVGPSRSSEDRGFQSEGRGGTQLGVGHDARGFGLRGGVLVSYALIQRVDRFLFLPDVQFRFGSRSRGWLEIGVGAYDASTTLRPGAYVGGGLVVTNPLTLSMHYGFHSPMGTLSFGDRLDLGAEYALSRAVRIGGGGSFQRGVGFGLGADFFSGIVEARVQTSFTF